MGGGRGGPEGRRHPRHEQLSSRLPSRLVSQASAPEFGDVLGKGSALVVTGSGGGRTRRPIHHIDANAECVLRVATRVCKNVGLVRHNGLSKPRIGRMLAVF